MRLKRSIYILYKLYVVDVHYYDQTKTVKASTPPAASAMNPPDDVSLTANKYHRASRNCARYMYVMRTLRPTGENATSNAHEEVWNVLEELSFVTQTQHRIVLYSYVL